MPTKAKHVIYSVESPHVVSDARIADGKVAFVAGPATNPQVYVYDITTKLLTKVTNVASQKRDVSISGNRVVWTDQRNGNKDIYMYDLSAKVEVQITTDSKDQEGPDIHGSKIVYYGLSETVAGGKHIFLYNID
jgi:beta propeller repeat protein